MYLSINCSEDVAAQYAHHFSYEKIDHSIVTKGMPGHDMRDIGLSRKELDLKTYKIQEISKR